MNSNVQFDTNTFSDEYKETTAEILSRELQRDSRRYSADFEN